MRLSFLALPALLLLAPISCSKNEEATAPAQSGAASLSEDPILAKLPPTASGFLIIKTEGPAFAEFEKTSWGKAMSAKGSGMDLFAEQARDQKAAKLLKALLKTPLVNPPAGTPRAVGEALFILDSAVPPTTSAGQRATPASTVSWGIILRGAGGQSLESRVKETEEALRGSGDVTTKEVTVAGQKGISTTANGESGELVMVHSLGDLVVGPNVQAVEKILTQGNGEGIKRIRALPSFAKISTAVSSTNQLSFGFVDIKPVTQAAKDTILQGVPAENRAAVEQGLQNLPVEALAYSRTIDGALRDEIAIATNPQTEEHKKSLAGLAPHTGGLATSGQVISLLPANGVVYLGLDGGIITGIKEEVVPLVSIGRKELGEALSTVQGIGLTVVNGQTGSPFPSAIVAVRSSNPASLKDALKKDLGTALAASAGVPLNSWQSKEVSGVSVEYATTPFGLGVYLAALPTAIILSTSEDAVGAAVAASKGGASLLTSLPPAAKLRIEKNSPPFLAYADTSRVAALMESVQANLAMFTGGKPLVDPGHIAMMRTLGSTAFSLQLEGDVIKIEGNYAEAPPQPAAK